MKRICLLPIILIFLSACTPEVQPDVSTHQNNDPLLNKYTSFKLTSDLSDFNDSQRTMISKLIDAAKIMDTLFWYEAFGSKEDALNLGNSESLREFITINYGPSDRLNNNQSFISAKGKKPAGANFYPIDMTKEEFESWEMEEKKSQYTFVRRDEDGKLFTIPYHIMFSEQIQKASNLLRECALLSDDEGFSRYLSLRADALLTDEYQASDIAWMDMKTNSIDVVIGPIENYEDALYNYKSAHEAYVLIKDMEWSAKLEKYVAYLPELQKGIPVSNAYKQEKPGANADLNAYDVVYYAGDCNAGSKTIAINLPNDEQVQLEKGSRRLQLKNAMRAKYEKILLPIADALIDPAQRELISFDAFFANTMFHEVAHGLGIKNTINGKGTVREALKENYSALEEGKADVLGLYMITQLQEKGEIKEEMETFYVTFMAGIFRSVRFGASSAHGKANMLRFNFFEEQGAFTKNSETGYYHVNFDKMKLAMNALSEKILSLQGDGNYEGVSDWVANQGSIKSDLQGDLDRLITLGIPVDIIFEQGAEVLGL
jgi:hypothetical protein